MKNRVRYSLMTASLTVLLTGCGGGSDEIAEPAVNEGSPGGGFSPSPLPAAPVTPLVPNPVIAPIPNPVVGPTPNPVINPAPNPIIGPPPAPIISPTPNPSLGALPDPGIGISGPEVNPLPSPGFNPLPSPGFNPLPSAGLSGPFTAAASVAPLNGETVSGITRLEVVGSNLRNVELLPATGYSPVYARFSVTPTGDRAFADFDTRFIPNGPLNVRISAFNIPAGGVGASEVIAMTPRTWFIQNQQPVLF